MSRTPLSELDEKGIVILSDLVTPDQLSGMQTAFGARLQRMRWNDVDGYEKSEPYRHMVQDVLTLDQGFLDLALHPTVKDILRQYLGARYELVEAKGWKSLPTNRDFHGWHGDIWYDQSRIQDIPREVKLAAYLTDVRSGAFTYIIGSHRRQHPRTVKSAELRDVPRSSVIEATGPAGTVILFDTSGIHRQGTPILEERHAVFLNYHDPDIPLQQEDLAYYRYHPLLLNAAFLGELSEEDQRVLGFGNKTNYIHAFQRQDKHVVLQDTFRAVLAMKLQLDHLGQRIGERLRRLVVPSKP
jgi:hypothetical protein